MCGIAAISSSTLTEGAMRAAMIRMTERMAARGPDGFGFHMPTPSLVLGHRRLAIIDLDPRANQPMSLSDSDTTIVFNGEIYNYRGLREELIKSGTILHTESDTEVLLHLYRLKGRNMLGLLRGMFAFVIWDDKKNSLFLARDPYGIKPLYYCATPQTFVVASQVKAILAAKLASYTPEPAGVVGFYLTGSVPEPWTPWKGIRAVPAGTWLEVDAQGTIESGCHRNIAALWREAQIATPRPALRRIVRNALSDTIEHHLVSDVPVAVFLSGGVDSGTIAGLMTERSPSVTGITITYLEYSGQREDEVAEARLTAAAYNIDHHVRVVSFEEFEHDVPRILDAMDQPSIDGVNTWFAAKAVAERGFKVALSGIGGDELFRGYGTFKDVPLMHHTARLLQNVPGIAPLGRVGFDLLARLGKPGRFGDFAERAKTFEGAYSLRRGLYSPSQIRRFLPVEEIEQGLQSLGLDSFGAPLAEVDLPKEKGAAVSILESTSYLRNQLLRDCDWASMSHSLELRTPLVDVFLTEKLAPFSAEFRNGNGKRMLASAPLRALPREVVTRRKTGFGIPMGHWLRKSTFVRGRGLDLEDPLHRAWPMLWARLVASHAGL